MPPTAKTMVGKRRLCSGALWITCCPELSILRDNETAGIPDFTGTCWCRPQVEEDFVAAIRKQGSIRRTTFEQGVRYMEFTDAVTRSIQSGCTVRLPLV